jgi:hypothetical protein
MFAFKAIEIGGVGVARLPRSVKGDAPAEGTARVILNARPSGSRAAEDLAGLPLRA